MSTSRKILYHSALPLTGVVLALTAGALLGGCVEQVRVAPPPPPRVYVPPPPPPPPAYVAPAAEVEVQANEAPPPLPDYEQPPCPEDGYLWTPGYWAWGGGGYYWVPGTWVQPPRVGVLWTPGYWGFVGGVYAFHAGYWGPHVGFYGGVNYGFGYVGVGFAGGRWAGNSFAYNQSVTNVNVTNIHNTYNTTVINNVTVNKVSYNGGAGGIAAVPTAQERVAAQEPRMWRRRLCSVSTSRKPRAIPRTGCQSQRAPSFDRRDTEARRFQCAGSGRCAWRGHPAKDTRRCAQWGHARSGQCAQWGDARSGRCAERGDARAGWCAEHREPRARIDGEGAAAETLVKHKAPPKEDKRDHGDKPR